MRSSRRGWIFSSVSMGDRKRRRQNFFSEHPTCCFCGGGEPAVEEDHQPPRATFDGRQWPEGYNFPSCRGCNDATRADEHILAFLSRMKHHNDELNATQETDIKRSMDGISRNFPGLLPSLVASTRDVRNFLKKFGQPKAPGAFLSDVPIMSLKNPILHAAVHRCAAKLFCALHYLHTHTIVPREAVIHTRWYSNAQIYDGTLPADVLAKFPNGTDLRRGKNQLIDQFAYRYMILSDGSAFICRFRDSFALLGMVILQPKEQDLSTDIEAISIGRPFAWPN